MAIVNVYLYNVDYFGLGPKTFLVTDPTTTPPLKVFRPPFWVPRPPDDVLWTPTLETLNAATFQLAKQSPFSFKSQWPYRYDDTPTWWPESENLDSPFQLLPTAVTPPQATLSFSPFFPFKYDETAPWQLTSLNAPYQLLVSAALMSRAPSYALRPASEEIWVGAPIGVGTVRLPTAGTPFSFELQWPYRYDDTPTWQVDNNSLNSAIIQNLSQPQIFGQGGQVPPFRWNYTLDDPPSWQWPMAERNRNILSVPPFVPGKWWQYDETPFWALPSDWLNSNAINLTTTQTKFYGQPGQVVPFRWNYTIDDPPIWVGTPTGADPNFLPKVTAPFSFELQWPYRYDDTPTWQVENNLLSSAVIQILSQPKIFGQGGQVPPYRWNYTIDDPANWLGTPLASRAIVVTTTQVKFYGQPGQAPTKRWVSYLDDPPPWSPASETLNSYIVTYAPPAANVPINIVRAPFYFSRPASEEIWVGAPVASDPNFIPKVNNPFSFELQWPYRYDDTPTWQIDANSLNSAIIQNLSQPKIFGQGGQVPPFRWNYTLDDPSVWSGEPINSAPIQLLTAVKIFGQGGQVPPFRWNYTLDDPPPWQPFIRSLDAVVLQLQSLAIPIVNWRPTWYSEDAFWQGSSASSRAITLTTTQVKFYGQPGQAYPFRWNWTQDDPPAWQWPMAERNKNVLFTVTSPLVHAPITWYSEDALWQGTPEASAAITLTTTQVKFFGQPGQAPPFRWNYTLDDPPSWQWPSYERNVNVLKVSVQNPFSNRQYGWNVDDQPTWQWPKYTATLIPLSVQLYMLPATISFSYDDPPTWQWTGWQRNTNVLKPPIPSPFSNRQTWWNIDDASLWQGTPLSSQAIVVTTTQTKFYGQPGQVVPFRWNWTDNDPPNWQWPLYERNRNVLFTVASPITNPPVKWYSEDAFWQGTPAPSYSITLTTTQTKFYGQPGQVVPFRWNWTDNDPPPWTWPSQARNRNVLFTVLSPLVYPPRQWYSEDAFWQGSPVPSYSITLTTTQAKFFGQPGQAPPFRWNATYNDPSLWSWTGATRNRNVLLPTIPPLVYPPQQWYSEDSFWQGVPTRAQIISLLSVPKVYGQGGQVPTPRWARAYTLDEPPMWQGTPWHAAAIQLTTTQQRMYGQPGEVIPLWFKYNYDDHSHLNWPTTELNFPLLFNIFVPPPGPSANVVFAFGTVRGMRALGTVSAFSVQGTLRGLPAKGTIN